MRNLATLLATLVVAGFGFAGVANADDLDAPTALSCSLPGTDYIVRWDAIAGGDFEKYAVSIECVDEQTDADGDEANIFTGAFDTGTSECFVAAVGGEDPEPEQGVVGVDCNGLLSTLITIDSALIVDDEGFNPDPGNTCTVTVKGVHSGRGKGRQNSTNHAEAMADCPDYPVQP